MKQAKWVDKLSATLLPVSYFHLVFTIPSELNRLALVNQKCLYDILFKAASGSLLLLSRDKKHMNVQSGLVAVLHT
ncbi:MAG: IS91 family transposase, partial [bacterium]|nr:IS91 family transposase [bacterium]